MYIHIVMYYLIMMRLGPTVPQTVLEHSWSPVCPSALYLEPSARPNGLCLEPSQVQRAERPIITQLANLNTQLYLD